MAVSVIYSLLHYELVTDTLLLCLLQFLYIFMTNVFCFCSFYQVEITTETERDAKAMRRSEAKISKKMIKSGPPLGRWEGKDKEFRHGLFSTQWAVSLNFNEELSGGALVPVFVCAWWSGSPWIIQQLLDPAEFFIRLRHEASRQLRTASPCRQCDW